MDHGMVDGCDLMSHGGVEGSKVLSKRTRTAATSTTTTTTGDPQSQTRILVGLGRWPDGLHLQCTPSDTLVSRQMVDAVRALSDHPWGH